jgi:ketosteroid isomerase-like protein
MSQENVEIVRRAWEMLAKAVRRGDPPGAAFDECVREGIIASNLDWRAGVRGGAGAVGIGDFAGRDGFVEFMRRWTEDFDDFAIELEEIIDAGNDRVVAITRQRGTGKASGATVHIRTGAIYTLDTHRIVRVELFHQPRDALEAAGLEK